MRSCAGPLFLHSFQDGNRWVVTPSRCKKHIFVDSTVLQSFLANSRLLRPKCLLGIEISKEAAAKWCQKKILAQLMDVELLPRNSTVRMLRKQLTWNVSNGQFSFSFSESAFALNVLDSESSKILTIKCFFQTMNRPSNGSIWFKVVICSRLKLPCMVICSSPSQSNSSEHFIYFTHFHLRAVQKFETLLKRHFKLWVYLSL